MNKFWKFCVSKCSAALSIKTAIPVLNVAVINCKVILHLSKCSDHICFSTFPVLLSTSNWRKQKSSSDLYCHIIDDDESLVFIYYLETTVFTGSICSIQRKSLQCPRLKVAHTRSGAYCQTVTFTGFCSVSSSLSV